ncbi:MAG: LuxR C-terminal-related transcriptional regulator [Candidatus Promineifilaceae bacterium]|jgi:two-component system, NarL family, nitrate/nitrite response regulator NarL
MIRIVIVHPSLLVCSLYSSVLDQRPNMEVVGRATTVKEALMRVQESDCNLILVSANLEDNGALALTRKIAQEHPELKVLVVGMPESKYVILQYVMAGASGYVLQDVSVDQLLQNIRAAEEDKALVSPTMAAALIDHVAELAHISARPYIQPEAYSELTARELEVLQLIDEGLTNQEISNELVIEVGTVKNHVHNILRKLDVASREDAAAHLPYIQLDEDE